MQPSEIAKRIAISLALLIFFSGRVDFTHYDFSVALMTGGEGKNSHFLKVFVFLLGTDFPIMCFDTFFICQVTLVLLDLVHL